jgi:pyridoxal phosphate enzyme (YggS family)
MSELATKLRANFESVQDRIANAAVASGRDPSTVTLIAVTKYVDAELTRAMAHAGCKILGENRPQQLAAKAEALCGEPNIVWHLIGHLQRNKVEKTLPHADLIHSVDSLRLLEAIDKAAAKRETCQDILLEVNISGDDAKHGFTAEEMPDALQSAAELANVRVRGLMTMAALEGGVASAEQNFAEMHELHQQLATSAPEGVSLNELSMGMSRDFEVAIKHGATMVRVGSALIEGVQ